MEARDGGINCRNPLMRECPSNPRQLPQEDSVEQATAYICGTYCGRPEDLNAGAAATNGYACIYLIGPIGFPTSKQTETTQMQGVALMLTYEKFLRVPDLRLRCRTGETTYLAI